MARSLLSVLLIPLLLTPLSCRSLTPGAPPPATETEKVAPVTTTTPEAPAPEQGTRSPSDPVDPLAQSVEIRRTSFGVPHILAEDLGGAGYGLAWVMMEDYREEVARAILISNGRWGLAR